MRLLDRYVLKNFLTPFLYCFLGFLAIWLVFDLNDNGPDFIQAKVSPMKVAYFYATQLPQIIVLCMPVGLLMALLYCLSRMSRSNEIISMLTAGQSVLRVIAPLIFAGLIATAVCQVLNYELAPRSEAMKKQLIDRFVHEKERGESVGGMLFRNRADHRTWFAREISMKEQKLKGVHVIQQDEHANILEKHYAQRAVYKPATHEWLLQRGKTVRFDKEGTVTEENWLDGERLFKDWSETPWRISSSTLNPQEMGVPELRTYLANNGDFPDTMLAPFRTHLAYRWAVPWVCLVVVLLAAPMGIVFSRRAVLASVASSIFIFFGYLFLDKLFLAFGKGGHLPPVVSAWGPIVFFAMVGLYLLYLRSTNREAPWKK